LLIWRPKGDQPEDQHKLPITIRILNCPEAGTQKARKQEETARLHSPSCQIVLHRTDSWQQPEGLWSDDQGYEVPHQVGQGTID